MRRGRSMVGLVKGHVGGLKVYLRTLFGTRLKAKGGGGTPRLAKWGVGILFPVL